MYFITGDEQAQLNRVCLFSFLWCLSCFQRIQGGGRVVLWCWVKKNFQYWGILLIWIIVGQVPTVLAVGESVMVVWLVD